MTKALAREVGSRGITVNCVAPGFIETDMTRALSEQQTQALLGADPARPPRPGGRHRRSGRVPGVAAAAYITGAELHVNGGMFMN